MPHSEETHEALQRKIRSAVSHPAARSALDDLFSAPTYGDLPESLLRTLDQALSDPRIEQVKATASGDVATDAFRLLGLNPNQFTSAPAARGHLLVQLERLRAIGQPCCDMRAACQPPVIDSITTFVYDMAAGVLPGEPLTRVKPGTVITLVGKHFSPVASENGLTIFGQAHPVVLATSTTLTTIVLPAVEDFCNGDVELKTGEVEVLVETVAGTGRETILIDVLDLEAVDGGEFDSFVDGSRNLFGQIADRANASLHYLETLRATDDGGAIYDSAGSVSVLLGDVSKGLHIVQRVPSLLPDDQRHRVEKTLSAVIQNSGMLDTLEEIQKHYDDPKAAFAAGSGFLDALCFTRKFMWVLTLLAVIFFVILAVIIVLMIILGPETGGFTFVIGFIVLIAEWVLTVLIWSLVLVSVFIEILYQIFEEIFG